MFLASMYQSFFSLLCCYFPHCKGLFSKQVDPNLDYIKWVAICRKLLPMIQNNCTLLWFTSHILNNI